MDSPTVTGNAVEPVGSIAEPQQIVATLGPEMNAALIPPSRMTGDSQADQQRSVALSPGRALVHASAMVGAIWAALAWAMPHLVGLTHNALAFWTPRVGLDAAVVKTRAMLIGSTSTDFLSLAGPSRAVDSTILATLGVLSLAFLLVSFRLPRAWLPIAQVMRVLCGLQLLVIAILAFSAGLPDISVAEHTRALYIVSIAVIVAVPLMLAPTFYVLELSILDKLIESAVIIGYFVIALPFKLITHAVLIQLCSPAVVPVLFLFGGPLLDAAIFFALYSAAMSRPSKHAPPLLARAWQWMRARRAPTIGNSEN